MENIKNKTITQELQNNNIIIQSNEGKTKLEILPKNEISINDPVGIELKTLISNWDIKDMRKDEGYKRGDAEFVQQILDVINKNL